MTATRDELDHQPESPSSSRADESAEPASTGGWAAFKQAQRERTTSVLLGLITLIPVAFATLDAIRAPRLHFLLDYWHVVWKVTNGGGALVPRALFTYHLEQPFVIPSLLFWVDARFLGGDNRTLSVFTIVLLLAILVILRAMLPRDFGVVKKAALTVGFAFLLFSTNATELWAQATNGISWIPAVFCSVLALFFAQRGRILPAYLAGVLGCLCFSAAFPVWPALAIIAWLRRDRPWKVIAPVAAGLTVILVWLATRPPSYLQPLLTTSNEPDRRLAVLTAALGQLWTSSEPDIAIVIGVFTGAALLILGWMAVQSRLSTSETTAPQSAEAGWVGVGLYSIGLATMIGFGRTTLASLSLNAGVTSRYTIIAALATSALFVLFTLRRPQWPAAKVVALTLIVGLATFAVGSTKATNVRNSNGQAPLAALAMHVGATSTLSSLRIPSHSIQTGRAFKAYPFSRPLTLGCRGPGDPPPELGAHIDLSTLKPMGGVGDSMPAKGFVDTPVQGDSVISGWALVNDKPVDCVLVVDETGMVVGGGMKGVARPDVYRQLQNIDAGMGWNAIAIPNARNPIVVVSSDGVLYRVPGPAPK